MEAIDLRVDGRFPSDEELARLIPIFEAKEIDLKRPIRHWTINFIEKLHGQAPAEESRNAAA